MATNSFGLDAAYFSDKLSLVLRDLGHFTPEELARTLARMARTACEGVLGEAEFAVQAAPTCAAQDGDAQLDAMRRSGLSIDGDNAYKRDLIDCIVGALMLGKQGVNPPPAGHWLEQFWQMARGEGEIQEGLAKALPAAEQPDDMAMPGVLELLRERRELDGDARYLFGDDRVWAEKADAFLVSTAAEQPGAAVVPVAQEPVAFAVMTGDKVRELRVFRGQAETYADAWNAGGMDEVARVVPLYTAPPAAEQPTGTTSDQYRAELYDEVWERARSMGYGNVTDALADLERMKSAEQPDTVAAPRELLAEAESIIDSYAEALRASHAPGGDWDGEEAAHDEYEFEAGVASKLRALLAGGR